MIGILHPGEMGVLLAASARNSGFEVGWAAEGRSAATRERAEAHGLRELPTLAALCRASSMIVSVCPPHAAEALAGAVMAAGFRGLFVDANAIAPERAIALGRTMEQAGIAFVDGGVVGLPTWTPRSTWLYLSGPRAAEAAAGFTAGPLETEVLGPDAGAASALKMCFAAYTKGRAALLAGILGTAERLGVRAALERQWGWNDAAFPAETANRVRAVARKAWRFEGEMREIAATFQQAGMPGGFHAAAEEIYRRLGRFKDATPPPELEAILEALLEEDRPASSPLTAES